MFSLYRTRWWQWVENIIWADHISRISFKYFSCMGRKNCKLINCDMCLSIYDSSLSQSCKPVFSWTAMLVIFNIQTYLPIKFVHIFIIYLLTKIRPMTRYFVKSLWRSFTPEEYFTKSFIFISYHNTKFLNFTKLTICYNRSYGI